MSRWAFVLGGFFFCSICMVSFTTFEYLSESNVKKFLNLLFIAVIISTPLTLCLLIFLTKKPNTANTDNKVKMENFVLPLLLHFFPSSKIQDISKEIKWAIKCISEVFFARWVVKSTLLLMVGFCSLVGVYYFNEQLRRMDTQNRLLKEQVNRMDIQDAVLTMSITKSVREMMDPDVNTDKNKATSHDFNCYDREEDANALGGFVSNLVKFKVTMKPPQHGDVDPYTLTMIQTKLQNSKVRTFILGAIKELLFDANGKVALSALTILDRVSETEMIDLPNGLEVKIHSVNIENIELNKLRNITVTFIDSYIGMLDCKYCFVKLKDSYVHNIITTDLVSEGSYLRYTKPTRAPDYSPNLTGGVVNKPKPQYVDDLFHRVERSIIDVTELDDINQLLSHSSDNKINYETPGKRQSMWLRREILNSILLTSTNRRDSEKELNYSSGFHRSNVLKCKEISSMSALFKNLEFELLDI